MNFYKEIYNVEDAGVDPVREFNLYGKIAVMQLFRYKVLDHLPSGKILNIRFRMKKKTVYLYLQTVATYVYLNITKEIITK